MVMSNIKADKASVEISEINVELASDNNETSELKPELVAQLEPYHQKVDSGETFDANDFLIDIKTEQITMQKRNYVSHLHLSLEFGLNEIVEALLSTDHVDINCVDDNGQTPLHYLTKAIPKNESIKALLYKCLDT